MNVQKLKTFFLNKICTVLTRDYNLPIKNHLEYSKFFFGEIVEIDDSGVYMKSLEFKTLAFFPFPCALIEEQYIPENHPQAQKIKSELEEKNKTEMPKDRITVEELTKKVRNLMTNH